MFEKVQHLIFGFILILFLKFKVGRNKKCHFVE